MILSPFTKAFFKSNLEVWVPPPAESGYLVLIQIGRSTPGHINCMKLKIDPKTVTNGDKYIILTLYNGDAHPKSPDDWVKRAINRLKGMNQLFL
jgi:hypothetical protein